MSTNAEMGGSPEAEKEGAAAPEPRKKRQPLAPAPLDDHGRVDTSKMSVPQDAMRQSVVEWFHAKKAGNYLQQQINHIMSARELVSGIQFLFDENGHAPANAPLEDIVEQRRMIEYRLLWLESYAKEMRERLIRMREIEDAALEVLVRNETDA
jgi:hypothetical protein